MPILAIAALGRSIFQIVDHFHEAPVAFTLSAVAALVYILATISLALGWDRVAWVTISFELAGVLLIGTVSLLAPALLGHRRHRPVRSGGDGLERIRHGLSVDPACAAGARDPVSPVAADRRDRS